MSHKLHRHDPIPELSMSCCTNSSDGTPHSANPSCSIIPNLTKPETSVPCVSSACINSHDGWLHGHGDSFLFCRRQSKVSVRSDQVLLGNLKLPTEKYICCEWPQTPERHTINASESQIVCAKNTWKLQFSWLHKNRKLKFCQAQIVQNLTQFRPGGPGPTRPESQGFGEFLLSSFVAKLGSLCIFNEQSKLCTISNIVIAQIRKPVGLH